MTRSGPRRFGWAASVAIAVVTGLAVGVLTVLGQRALPGRVAGVANSGAVWLIPIAIIGSLMATDARAATAGAVALLATVIGYYASVPALVEGAAADARSVAIWGAAALVAGPVFGVAGRWARGAQARRRPGALAFLGGVFLAEGARRVVVLPHDTVLGVAMILVGVAVPLALGRSARERSVAALAEIPVVLVTLGAFALIDRLFLGS